MGNPFNEAMRVEAAKRRAFSELPLRIRIEEDLEYEWYTVDMAAEELDLHPKTVRKRIREGKLKASRPSERKTRIHYSDLAAYKSRRKPAD
jgi:excisionase family DNA binding protein